MPRTVFYLGFQIHWHNFMLIISDESYGSKVIFLLAFLMFIYSFSYPSGSDLKIKLTVLLVFKKLSAFC